MLRMLWNTLNLLTIDLLQKAEAELAYELQAAKTKQRIKEENMQIKVTTALLTKKTEIIPLKGILHQKIFYRLNLIFWIVMGCGIARFGRKGLKTTET